MNFCLPWRWSPPPTFTTPSFPSPPARASAISATTCFIHCGWSVIYCRANGAARARRPSGFSSTPPSAWPAWAIPPRTNTGSPTLAKISAKCSAIGVGNRKCICTCRCWVPPPNATCWAASAGWGSIPPRSRPPPDSAWASTTFPLAAAPSCKCSRPSTTRTNSPK